MEKTERDGRVFVQKAEYGNTAQICSAAEELFKKLPAAKSLAAGTRVVIKPNLLAKHTPEKAVTTHPDVLRAVILALQKRGVTDITVADSSGGPYTPSAMKSVYAGCGITKVCEETGAKLYTECKSVHLPAAKHSGAVVQSFEVLKPIAEADFIINLPKLKTHVLTGMSGAVKNLFGCVPGMQKAEFHMRFPQRQHFVQMLVDLCETVNADIHIADGTLGMEGDGPAGGAARPCGFLLAGENPYTVDMALCEYMGFNTADVPVLQAANKSGLCGTAAETAPEIEQGVQWPANGFKHPRSYSGTMNFAENVPGPFKGLANRFMEANAPRPAIKRKLCIGCGKCAQICPQRVIEIKNGKAEIAYKNCIRCFCCHEMCPVKAIDVRRPFIYRV